MNMKLRFAIAAALGSTNVFGAGSVTIDSTLPGHASNAIIPLIGGTYTIPASQGFVSGPGNATHNLFHSFLTFNVDTAETAKFTNDLSGTYASSSFSNIISRVTGGTSTTINGTIDSTAFPKANFWFVNPAGITIGSGATINVPAGLALGSADYIKFSDNSRWYAIGSNSPTPSVLSTASPVSFGFVSRSPPTLVETGGTNSTPSGHTSLVAGGAVTLQSVHIDTSSTGATIAITGSSVELDNSLLETGGGDVNVTGSAGSVVLQGSTVDTYGSNNLLTGGNILITGAGVLIAGQSLLSAAAVFAGNITVQSTGTAAEANPQTILDHATNGVVRIVDSQVYSPVGEGTGGTITIGAGEPGSSGPNSGNATNDVVIAGSQIVGGGTAYLGNVAVGDNVIINATRGVWIDNSLVSSIASNFQGGDEPSGHIYIGSGVGGVTIAHTIISTDDSVVDNNQYNIFAPSSIKITASGGAINLSASSLSAQALGTEPPGTITVQTSAILGAAQTDAATAIVLTDAQLNTTSQVGPTGLPNNINPVGTITISSAGDLAMSSGSSIISNAEVGAAAPGLIQVTAGGSLNAQGSAIKTVDDVGFNMAVGGISLSSKNAVSLVDMSIDASTTAGSPGGTILIAAPKVTISGGNISTSAIDGNVLYNSVGNAGDITIAASGTDTQGSPALQIVGTTVQSTALGKPSTSTLSQGNAGAINIAASAGSIVLGNASSGPLSTTITTSANQFAVQAGTIKISAGRNLTLQDTSVDTSVATTAGSPSSTPGTGTITLTAPGAVTVTGSTLNARTAGTVAAGDITMTGSTVNVTGSSVTASTTGSGNAGVIGVTAGGADQGGAALHVTGGSTISSDANAGQSGANAGSVTLLASNGSVQIGLPGDAAQTQISTAAGPQAGAAGAVTVTGTAIALGDASVTTTAGGVGTNASGAKFDQLDRPQRHGAVDGGEQHVECDDHRRPAGWHN
jgi:filamentous hemagglutinin family protein